MDTWAATPDLFDVEREVLGVVLLQNAELLAAGLRGTSGDEGPSLLGSLAATHSLGLLLDDVVRVLVHQARAEGHTWAVLGEVLHVSRQAVFQRFGAEDETAVTEEPDETISGAAERATAMFKDFVAGRWEVVRADFDARMSDACPAELLRSVRSKVDDEVGQLVRIRKPSVRLHNGYTVVDMPLVYGRGVRKGRVTFDRDGRVAGFFVLEA